MIDLTQEPLIRLTDAARLAGPSRGNRPTHLSTVLRWILQGLNTPTGIVRLDAVRIGSKWMTSAAAVQRFVEMLTPSLGSDGKPTPRTRTQRQRANENAKNELDELGI